MLSLRLDLLFTIREFPVNMDDFQPVSIIHIHIQVAQFAIKT